MNIGQHYLTDQVDMRHMPGECKKSLIGAGSQETCGDNLWENSLTVGQ